MKRIFPGPNAVPLVIAGALSSLLSLPAVADEYSVTVTNLTSGVHFTPLIVATHSPEIQMFEAGMPASAELQAIAEGGDTSALAALLESHGAQIAHGGGLIAPGGSETIMIQGDEDDRLSLAGMLLPTNDGFVGINAVALPDDDHPAVHHAVGYDAGTEGNDEIIGSGAPGEAGFPAPPPIVATGTGTGGSGFHLDPEGFVHVHRGVVGDHDAHGGISDINAAVHRWLNPLAMVSIIRIDDDDDDDDEDMDDHDRDEDLSVSGLHGAVYSRSALEIFWYPAMSTDSYVTAYEIRRNGTLLDTRDALSYFDDGLHTDTEYHYEVRAMDAGGHTGAPASISLRTN